MVIVMRCVCKPMKAVIGVILCLMIVLLGIIFWQKKSSALTFSQEIGVSFTFNPMFRIMISSDLYIYNLASGTVLDSNIIDVGVITNNITGYSLNATVGNSTYNTRNLVHEMAGASFNFASVNYGSNLTNLTTDNTWGYAFSLDDGSNWSNYSGLPLYSDGMNVATLKTSTSPSDAVGDYIKFKIAARAASTQAAGVYHNVINFIGVGNVVPQYTVQFDSNDGTGTMPNQIIFRDEPTMLSVNLFAPPAGKVFAGWNTATDGSGTAYTDQQQVTNLAVDGGTVVLYAQWEQKNPCKNDTTSLYCKVVALVKKTNNQPRTQTSADLRAVITVPTSSDPAVDTSNSGVYLYNESIFGTPSDANNAFPIYYYRGILDSDLDDTSSSSYGSNGDGAYYPNYVRLGNTCWRIVRTTGSGGVKMIYNGLYSSGTTANSCANATTNAEIADKRFGLQGNSAESTNWHYNINRVGYTFNNDISIQDVTTDTSVDIILGSNSNYITTNTADSNIKDYLENTWFTSSNGISAYESILEPSAGYCNDRITYNSNASYVITTMPPYIRSDANIVRFGSQIRNLMTNRRLSLSCPRGTVDLYTTASATNGNKQLNKPVVLFTVDEVALAGSGYGGRTSVLSYSSNYSYSSYLRSGSSYWLLSPTCRESNGDVWGYYLNTSGYPGSTSMRSFNGVRPAISLIYGTTPTSGTGTAIDPWVINAP